MATLTERVQALTERGYDFALIGALLDITPQQVEDIWQRGKLVSSLTRDLFTPSPVPFSVNALAAGREHDNDPASAFLVWTDTRHFLGAAKLDGRIISSEWVTLASAPQGTLCVGDEYIYWNTTEGVDRVCTEGVQAELESKWLAVPECIGLATFGGWLAYSHTGFVGRAKGDGEREQQDEWIALPGRVTLASAEQTLVSDGTFLYLAVEIDNGTSERPQFIARLRIAGSGGYDWTWLPLSGFGSNRSLALGGDTLLVKIGNTDTSAVKLGTTIPTPLPILTAGDGLVRAPFFPVPYEDEVFFCSENAEELTVVGKAIIDI